MFPSLNVQIRCGCRCWPHVLVFSQTLPLPLSLSLPFNSLFFLSFTIVPQMFSFWVFLPYNSPMQSVSELGMQDRISTSFSEHSVHLWQGLVLPFSSEKVPSLQFWHCVSPCRPHCCVAPLPREHLEQGAHRRYSRIKKKPLSHSQCVSLVAEQDDTVGTLGGQPEQGRQRPRSSEEENVPGRQIKHLLSVWKSLFQKYQ